MAKPWIVSGLLVAFVVGAVLYITKEPSVADDGDKSALPSAPPSLNEKEIITYIEVWRGIDLILKKAATIAVNAKIAKQPMPPEASGRPHVQALLKQHNMTLSDWKVLRDRVEFVVGVLRFERDKPARDQRIADDIAEKEKMLTQVPGKARKSIETTIARLQEQQRAVPKPITQQSRKLARKYWKSLDAIVPGGG